MGAPNTSGMTNTANTLMSGQQGIYNSILSQLGASGGYGQTAAGLQGMLGPLSGIFSNIMGGAGQMTPQMMQQFMQLGASPQALAAFTGVNAPGLMQGATNYLSQPGATNLAQFYGGPGGAAAQLAPGQSVLNTAGPQAMSVYRQMTQGLNPQFMTNAQNQLQQQFGTSVSDILAQAAPGQNTQSAITQAQNQLLGSSANLAGQLAGESQQVAAQGAGGLVSTGQAMDANTLSRLMGQGQLAGTLDQQTMNMLTQAAQLGSAYNQQALGNVGQGAQMGLSGLSGAESLGQLGVGMNQFGMNELTGIAGTQGQEAMGLTQLAAQLQASAPNPWSLGAQLLGGLGGAYLGGPGASSSLLQGGGKSPGSGGSGGINTSAIPSPGQYMNLSTGFNPMSYFGMGYQGGFPGGW